MPTSPPPSRRNWHLSRWLIVIVAAVMGWGGWRAYAFRTALSQAKALGWEVDYTDPSEEIRKNWKAAFKKETWLDGVTDVRIPTSESFELHPSIIHRLNPKILHIPTATEWRDLSALKSLTQLRWVWLANCTGLTNVDGLKNLTTLQAVDFNGCTGLTNVDAFKNLTQLRQVILIGCTGLTNVDGLKNLPSLRWVYLHGCTGLTNVDGLKNLSALQKVVLDRCTGLTNVDGLKNLRALEHVELKGCTGLTQESVAALRLALSKAKIVGP